MKSLWYIIIIGVFGFVIFKSSAPKYDKELMVVEPVSFSVQDSLRVKMHTKRLDSLLLLIEKNHKYLEHHLKNVTLSENR